MANRDCTDWAALAISDLGVAAAELGWALASGETGLAFAERIMKAREVLHRADHHLVNIQHQQTP